MGISGFQCSHRMQPSSTPSPCPGTELFPFLSVFVCFYLTQGSVRLNTRNIPFAKLFACFVFDSGSIPAQGILSSTSKLTPMGRFLWKVPRHTEGRSSPCLVSSFWEERWLKGRLSAKNSLKYIYITKLLQNSKERQVLRTFQQMAFGSSILIQSLTCFFI